METTGTIYIRKCKDCGLEAYDYKDLTLFTKRKDLKYGHTNLCKQCRQKRYKSNDNQRYSYVPKKYGITINEYKSIMAVYKSCELCGSSKTLCYDHCHTTGKFRGVLCRKCNKAIGQLGDNVEGVRIALNYLVKHYQ